MKKIFLCCAAGMSTSMVMNKMKQAAAGKALLSILLLFQWMILNARYQITIAVF